MAVRWLRRARPLLGTLVEVGVPHGHDAALEQAFAAIGQVQRLMSIHNPQSDIGRLHAAPVDADIDIHPWTADVLQLARSLSTQTHGLFDVARGSGAWSCRLDHDRIRAVRHAASCRLDLGGIAKGWAVDKAVETLIECGIDMLWVNAGGDLRCRGVTLPVSLRDEIGGGVKPWLQLSDGAMATSWFADDARSSLHGRRGAMHVSVAAPRCAVADALTKVAAQVGDGDEAWFRALLDRHEAQVWFHGQSGFGLAAGGAWVS